MARTRHTRRSPVLRLLETLESRVLLSVAYADPGKGGAGKPGPTNGPAIELAWVALHEFGHSLGLPHFSDPDSIMYPYYNPSYDFTNFSSDLAVTAFNKLLDDGTFAWKNSLDSDPTDNTITITYSWVLDGARMDSGGRSNTFAAFGPAGSTKMNAVMNIVIAALDQWASVSGKRVNFAAIDADGIENAVYDFGVSGNAQGDSRFGDIRIAAHKFDGAGKTLAHTYYPPPNGGTAAGDAHFDADENWQTTLSFSSSTSSTTPTVGASTFGNANAIAAARVESASVVASAKASQTTLIIVASNYGSRSESPRSAQSDTVVLLDRSLRSVLA